MKIRAVEPWIFLFFGVFHLHRIWGLIDRASYAAFWIGVMVERGAIYFLLMAIMSILCIAGIVIFLTNLHETPWWRWVYPLCGGYVLFDLLAIATGRPFWRMLIESMYDVTAPYWNVLWGAFILLGCASTLLGLALLRQRAAARRNNP